MSISGKNILVTGAMGFIGSKITSLLNRDNQVTGIDIKSPKDDSKIEGVNYVNIDISAHNALSSLKGDFDYIFHFGSPSSFELFKKDLYWNSQNTLMGFVNIMEFAKGNGVKGVVFPSSGTVYGNSARTLDRSFEPINMYGVLKLAHEKISNLYKNEFKVKGLRIFMGYGPGEETKSSIGSPLYLFLNEILRNKKPIIWGDGSQTRDLVYIEDIAEIAIKCLDSNDKRDNFFDIGTGINTSFLTIIRYIEEILNINVKPQFVPRPSNYLETTVADPTIAEHILGRKLTLPRTGITKFIEYLSEIV